MKNLAVSLLILAVFTTSFLFLGGGEKTGDERLGIGLVSLAPLVGAAYLLNNFPQARSFGLLGATVAIFFGVTVPIGGCMVPVSLAALVIFLVMARSYVQGRISWLPVCATTPSWVWLLGQFSAIAVFAAWLVHQIF